MGREEKGTAREDKLKALDAALSQIEKQYGKGSVMKLGDTSHMQVETVPTGSLSLDSPAVRPRLHYIWWQRCRREAALPGLLMRSMRWIRSMPSTLA